VQAGAVQRQDWLLSLGAGANSTMNRGGVGTRAEAGAEEFKSSAGDEGFTSVIMG
jgi:hypothetical protein